MNGTKATIIMRGATDDTGSIERGGPNELLQSPDGSQKHQSDWSFLGKLTEPGSVYRLNGDHADTTPRSGQQICTKSELNPMQPPSEQKKLPRVTTQLYTISYLIFFAIMGTLARLGLQALSSYPGAPVKTGLLWANFGGSLIMGFLAADRKLFGENPARSGTSRGGTLRINPIGNAAVDGNGATDETHVAGSKKSTPLYIGLTTGFCGSLTSFSAFIRDAFLALSNSLPVTSQEGSQSSRSAAEVHRHPGYGFLAVMAVLITTPMISLGAFRVGGHLALALDPFAPCLSLALVRRLVDRIMLLVAWLSWLGAILMAIWPPDRPDASVGRATWAQESWRGDSLFAAVFAPLGCLIRFYASLHLNQVHSSFPPGTFAVNIAGTALSAIFFDLQHIPIGGHIGCQVLQGAMDGFCGSLTTVSTWVMELRGLRLRHAYIYGLMSVGTGLGLTIAIMGSLRWTVGFQPPSCAH